MCYGEETTGTSKNSTGKEILMNLMFLFYYIINTLTLRRYYL